MKVIETSSPRDLAAAAREILDEIGNDTIILFRGEMGAGKTTLISAICEQLGSEDTVTSPTFAIINQYLDSEGGSIYHFDFYRIDDIREAYDFGYEEYFYSGSLCLVEWPEKIEELLPSQARTVTIEITGPESRKITVA